MSAQALIKQLGPRLRVARQKANLTVREAAEHVGVAHTMIVRYENNESLPPLDRLASMADIYRVSLPSLVVGDASLTLVERATNTQLSVTVYENPQFADFAQGETPGIPALADVLQQVAVTLGEVEQIAMTLDVGQKAEYALEQIEQAVIRIRYTIEERRAAR